MINITITKDKGIIKSIVCNPVLWNLAGHTEEPETYEINNSDVYLLIKIDGKIAGLVLLAPFTYVTAIGHINLLPDYHSTGTSVHVINGVRDFISRNMTYKNIVTTVPKECVYVIKLMYKTGFHLKGIIEDGVIYHDKTQDLIIFQLKV